MSFYNAQKNALSALFGNSQAGVVSIASQSIDYIVDLAQIGILTKTLPSTAAQIYTAWQAAIKTAQGSPTDPGNVNPEVAEEALWNAAEHALAVDLPNFINQVQAWYVQTGTLAVGDANAAASVPCPTLPPSLLAYIPGMTPAPILAS